MSAHLRDRLKIPPSCVDEINMLLLDPNNQAVNAFLEVVEKYGTPEEINRKAKEARRPANLMARLEEIAPSYVEDLKWLEEQRDTEAFISVADYRRRVLGDKANAMSFNEDLAVTLESMDIPEIKISTFVKYGKIDSSSLPCIRCVHISAEIIRHTTGYGLITRGCCCQPAQHGDKFNLNLFHVAVREFQRSCHSFGIDVPDEHF